MLCAKCDGYYGWEEYAPFDRIIVTCGIDHIPRRAQTLTPDGIMVFRGSDAGSSIAQITKKVDANGNVLLEREDVYKGKLRVKFVPFTAADGSWHSKENN
jgi:protein-L-isoaspartate(D-aspartate) O-methyltransferase